MWCRYRISLLDEFEMHYIAYAFGNWVLVGDKII